MLDLAFIARQVRIATGVIRVRSLVDSPQFFSLFAQRIESMNIVGKSPISSSLQCFAELSENPVDRAAAEGRISDALRLAQERKWALKFLRPRLEQHLREQARELYLSVPYTDEHTAKQARHAEEKVTSLTRVLHFLNNSEPHTSSGYTVRSQGILQAQKSAGIQTLAVTRLGYPAVVGRLAHSREELHTGVTYLRLMPRRFISSPVKIIEITVEMLSQLAKSFTPNVLHTTTPFRNGLVISRLAQVLRLPWVYEVRGEPEKTWLARRTAMGEKGAENSEYYRLSRSQETKVMQSATALVTLSHVQRRSLIARGIDPDKVFVIPNAISESVIDYSTDVGTAEYRARHRRKLGLPTDVALIGIISSLVDYEGIDDLIRSIVHLSDDVELVIVGDGTSRSSLEELAMEQGIASRVHFVGRQPADDIRDWYSCLDVFVVPRKNVEVCRVVTPIKPLMAMAAGCPVVASDLEPLREVTGELGIYVEPENSRMLAEGIRQALALPEGRTQEALNFVEERTWTSNAEKYAQVYNYCRKYSG